MPALGMAQETGKLLRWLKEPGDSVAKGEMLMEVETDKAMVEVEANAAGILADVTAQPGDVVPVGQVIARIVSAEELGKRATRATAGDRPQTTKAAPAAATGTTKISPLAARLAAEHGVDVSQIKTSKGVIQKEDVLAYVEAQRATKSATANPSPLAPLPMGEGDGTRMLASPKARRLASEGGVELVQVRGTGPDGAVIAADVEAAKRATTDRRPQPAEAVVATLVASGETPQVTTTVETTNVWRVMVERLSQAWTTIPHFYLTRDVNATRLMAWRDASKRGIEKLTYTDLLVKLVAATLEMHPRVNASWQNNELVLHPDINIGLAVAIEQGLTVPVIHKANELGLRELAAQRGALVERAHAGKLSVKDISGGTFTISNLGMYGIDAFNAIVNPPQAAILAVSRIAERVVPVNHQPSVQPMMTLTLSCDHRVIDGARGAQFLDALAQLIEEPLQLLD